MSRFESPEESPVRACECGEHPVCYESRTLCLACHLEALVSDDKHREALFVAYDNGLGAEVVYQLIAAEHAQRELCVAIRSGALVGT